MADKLLAEAAYGPNLDPGVVDEHAARVAEERGAPAVIDLGGENGFGLAEQCAKTVRVVDRGTHATEDLALGGRGIGTDLRPHRVHAAAAAGPQVLGDLAPEQ